MQLKLSFSPHLMHNPTSYGRKNIRFSQQRVTSANSMTLSIWQPQGQKTRSSLHQSILCNSKMSIIGKDQLTYLATSTLTDLMFTTFVGNKGKQREEIQFVSFHSKALETQRRIHTLFIPSTDGISLFALIWCLV